MRRILKIGGSLLLRPGLSKDLNQWISSQPAAQTIAIVGGGELIDAVRHLDQLHHCDAAWVHWRCVDLLRTTFDWLSDQLTGWEIHASSDQFDRLRQTHRPGCHLVAVDSFYHPDAGAELPLSWDTTTDAIAGWLAITLKADELVLLKSCDPPSSIDLGELAVNGFVDRALPPLADRLPPVTFINFGPSVENDS